MRRHRGSRHLEMGEAISFEDVLTVITVLLLLRVLFMVPLVNLDKAKTVRAKGDEYWKHQTSWLMGQPADTVAVVPYRTAFELEGSKTVIGPRGPYLMIESVGGDSSLLVVRQNLAESTYVAMRVQGPGHAKSFRRGRLLWSAAEQEWFTASDTVDYGSHVLSKGLEAQQRQFTKERRGY